MLVTIDIPENIAQMPAKQVKALVLKALTQHNSSVSPVTDSADNDTDPEKSSHIYNSYDDFLQEQQNI